MIDDGVIRMVDEYLDKNREGHGGTAVIDRLDDGSRSRNADWWTIKSSTIERLSCGHESPYVCTVDHPHQVIVWPSDDDPNLKTAARRLEERGCENIEVLPYEQSMGKSISYYSICPS